MKAHRIAVYATILLAGLVSAAAADKTVAHLTIHKEIREGPRPFTLFGDAGSLTLRRYLTRLNAAARDGSIDAVIITIDQPDMNWPQMRELRAGVDAVRRAGKPVWIYVEQADSKQYLLATAGDQVYISPAGGIGLVGVDATMVFLKGLLDKIGVQADLVQVGQFKGAAEPFTQTQPSDESRAEVSRLVDGLFEQMVSTVAAGRRLEPDKVRAAIDTGPFTAEAALEAGLVDRVATRAQMLADLEKKLGDTLAIRNNYGLATPGAAPDLSNPLELLRLLIASATPGQPGQRIGLVYIDGMIVSGESKDGLFGGRTIGSDTIRRALDQARADAGVQAVVIRIDSPGGSALASEVIWQAVRRLAETKPVVVSVGGMAASGGYYIASAGQTILAEPNSLVGSIGVVGGKVVLAGLLEKIGVTTTVVSRGANAGIFNVTRPFTAAERRRVGDMMQKTYQTFLDRIRTGRGDRIKDINAVAEGRVFLGQSAITNGLVDRDGGINDAIALAAGQAKLEVFQVEIMPTPKTLLDVLRQMFGGEGDGSLTVPMMHIGSQDRLGLLTRMLPRQVRQLSRQLLLLEQLEREQVLTAWPVPWDLE